MLSDIPYNRAAKDARDAARNALRPVDCLCRDGSVREAGRSPFRGLTQIAAEQCDMDRVQVAIPGNFYRAERLVWETVVPIPAPDPERAAER